MQNEKLVDVHSRRFRAAGRVSGNGEMPETLHEEPSSLQSMVEKFLPHGRLSRMTQEARGVFIPYPLLGILIIIGGALLSFVIAIEVQVSNLNTTILLREADQRAEMTAIKEKSAQLEVYIHNDREKLVHIETLLDGDKRR